MEKNKFIQDEYNNLRSRWLKTSDTKEGLNILEKMKLLKDDHPEINTKFGHDLK